MSKFDDDMAVSLRRQGDADRIYREILPVKHTERFPKNSPLHILDRKFAIDVVITLETGMIFTVQEKFRRHDVWRAGYRDFTLEYMSNKNGTKGEYFHLATDLYFYGWENHDRTGFIEANVFYAAPVKKAISDGRLRGRLIPNKKHSSATFYAYHFGQFREGWFLYKHEICRNSLELHELSYRL
jgi:hypothetical protein